MFDAGRYSESRVPWPVEYVHTRVHTQTPTRAGTGPCAHACTLAGEEEASRLWSRWSLLPPSHSFSFPGLQGAAPEPTWPTSCWGAGCRLDEAVEPDICSQGPLEGHRLIGTSDQEIRGKQTGSATPQPSLLFFEHRRQAAWHFAVRTPCFVDALKAAVLIPFYRLKKQRQVPYLRADSS